MDHIRAYRRSRKAAMKRKARALYPHDKNAKNADHLAKCSCHMCGNPRKHYKDVTTQERRAFLAADDQY